MTLLKQLLEDESAVSLTHYTMVFAIVTVASVGAMNVFIESFSGMVDRVGGVLDNI